MSDTEVAETAGETIETEAEAVASGNRSQMAKHEGFVTWYADEFEGFDLNTLTAAEIIAEFARLRNDFRRSDFYLDQWGPEARAAAAEIREAEREAAAKIREAEKAKRAAERAAKAEADAEAGENGEKPKRTKPVAKKRAVKRVARKPVETDETESAEDASEDEVFA